jgi:nicotinamidase/pyrazinamidase
MDALLVIDVQSDFCPGGALAVPEGDRVIPVINRMAGLFPVVVATQDWHPAHHLSFASAHGKKPGDIIELNGQPQVLWPDHCVQRTPGADFAPGLIVSRFEAIFQKGVDPAVDSYSGFFDNARRRKTGLADWLAARQVRRIFVAGLATDYCVQYTARDGAGLGFETCVVLEACRAVNRTPGDEAEAVEVMKSSGVRVLEKADEAIGLLRQISK